MPIQTRAEFETVQQALQQEMAKPEDQQDVEFLRAAVTQLREAEERIGPRVEGASAELVQQGALRGTEQPVLPKQEEIPGQGFSQTITPEQQIGSRAFNAAMSQRFTEIGDFFRRMGMSDEEQAALAQKRRERQARTELQVEEVARISGVDPASLKAAEVAGGLAPDVASAVIPGAIPLRTGAGALARVGAETAVGGVLSGSTVPLDEDAGMEAGIGALGGGVLGAVAEIPMLGRNFVFDTTRRALNSDDARIGREIEEITGITLSPAELSSNQAAASIEAGISPRSGGPKEQLMSNRQREISESFERLDATLNPQRLSTQTIIDRTADAAQRHVGELQTVRTSRFRERIAPAAEAMGATLLPDGRIVGGQRIPADNLVRELRQQAQLADEPLSGAAAGPLTQAADEIEEAGGLTLGELQRRLSDLTSAPKGVVKDRLNALDNLDTNLTRSALFRDMEAAEAGLESGPAVEALRAARTGYAEDSVPINRLRATATERLIDKVAGNTSDLEFAERLLKLPEAEFTELLRVVDSYNPGASQALRARMFFEIVDKHTVRSARASRPGQPEGMVDVQALMSELNRLPFSKMRAFVGGDLAPREARLLDAGIGALQKISEGPQKQGGARGLAKIVEDVAINMASQDIGFISRFLAGNFSPGFLERMLFTREGQRALMHMGDPKLAGPAFAQSVSYIANAMRAEDEQKEAIKQQMRAAEEERAGQIGRVAAGGL